MTDPRSLIVFAVVAAIVGVFAAWILYAIRDTIVSVYVSALFAMGISPLVKLIERQRAIPIGKRLPRWLAILIIYATIIAVVVSIGMIVIPPLIDQAEELWRSLPERFAQAQATLVRLGILRRPVTLGEAVQQTPAQRRRDAVTHALHHRAKRGGRRVRRHHAAAAHVLHAGRIARDLRVLREALSAARARRAWRRSARR